jgi:hypothetical protein
MYQTAFARPPMEHEVSIARRFLGDEPSEERWADYAHALINTKEFIFLR